MGSGHSSGSRVLESLMGNQVCTGFSDCPCEPLVEVMRRDVRSILRLESSQMPSVVILVP